MQLNQLDQTLLNLALTEDLGQPFYDATTDLLFADKTIPSQANIISKHPTEIVICGINVLQALFAKLPTPTKIETAHQDGDILPNGEILLTLHGDCRSLLMIERTALNFLRHLSAIATLTKVFVDKVNHTSLKILDTRKTTPGMRHLEKYAVACGGGVNHRMGLYDAIMIKDTHIDLLGGIKKVMEKLLAKKTAIKLPVIIEIRDYQELEQVLAQGQGIVDKVLLDNMNMLELSKCVQACAGIFETEASGNINLNNIAEIAKTGVAYASIGMLTHSAGQVDLSMQAPR